MADVSNGTLSGPGDPATGSVFARRDGKTTVTGDGASEAP